MANQLSVTVGASASGMPLNASVRQSIKAALKGGDATQSYFRAQQSVNSFMSAMQDPANWIVPSDQQVAQQQQPYAVAVQQSQDASGTTHTMQFLLKPKIHDGASGASAPGSAGSVLATNAGTSASGGAGTSDPTSGLPMIGSITGTLSYDEGSLWYVELPLFAVSGVVGAPVFNNVVWPILKAVWRGTCSVFQRAIGANGSTTAGEVADGATGDANTAARGLTQGGAAGAEGDVVLEKILFTSLSFSGLALLSVISTVIFEDVLHQSTQTLQVQNLTKYKLRWGAPYFDHGAMYQSPVTVAGGTSPDYVIPGISGFTPVAGLPAVEVAHTASFAMTSASETVGIAYVMPFTLLDGEKVVATAVVMFDIPFTGENSIYASWNDSTALDSYLSQHSGHVKQLSYSASQAPAGLSLDVSISALSGQHADPSGQLGYFYSSLIVFSQQEGATS